MNAKRLVCALVIGLASVQANCLGAIVLNINPVTDQLWFSGSDTGTLADNTPTFEATWKFGTDSIGLSIINDFDSPAFTPSPSTLDLAFLESGPDSPTGLSLFISYLSPETLLSAVPTVEFSYALLDDPYKDYLDNLSSGALPLTQGTGWGSISIVQVPEPTSLVLLGTACGFAAVVAMKRARARRRDGALQSSQRNA